MTALLWEDSGVILGSLTTSLMFVSTTTASWAKLGSPACQNKCVVIPSVQLLRAHLSKLAGAVHDKEGVQQMCLLLMCLQLLWLYQEGCRAELQL